MDGTLPVLPDSIRMGTRNPGTLNLAKLYIITFHQPRSPGHKGPFQKRYCLFWGGWTFSVVFSVAMKFHQRKSTSSNPEGRSTRSVIDITSDATSKNMNKGQSGQRNPWWHLVGFSYRDSDKWLVWIPIKNYRYDVIIHNDPVDFSYSMKIWLFFFCDGPQHYILHTGTRKDLIILQKKTAHLNSATLPWLFDYTHLCTVDMCCE